MSFRRVHPLVVTTETVKNGQISEVVKNKQADRRRQIALFARDVDLSNQVRQRHLLVKRDFF